MTVKKLLQIMDDLVAAQRELLAEVDRKRRLILDNHVDELAQCYRSELRLLEKIATIQSEWHSAVHQMLGMRDQQSQSQSHAQDQFRVQDSSKSFVDFRSVLERIESEEARSQLSAYEAQFLDLHAEIKRRNQQNQQLALHQLEYIDQMMELYQDPVDQGVTYGNPAGHTPSTSGRAIKRFESRA